jgi:hypothetical protein
MSDHPTPVAAPRSPGPAEVPSLAEVHADPTILARLPLTGLIRLRRQVGHLAADLDAALLTAMAQTPAPEAPQSSDRLLSPEAAAERFGVTKRWLLAHADHIPGVRRLSRKTVRFSERHLARFLDKAAI